MLINFDLTPVAAVAPWGPADNPSLSWFGLTEGRYWISAGSDTLFEYHERVRETLSAQYCDYYVARIFEDLLGILPAVLDPVPADLAHHMSADARRAWLDDYESWSERHLTPEATDAVWDVGERATALIGDRMLETSYLSPATSILLWSDHDRVHIEWDNRDKFVDDNPAWSALAGRFALPRQEFVNEVGAFHAALLDQMEARIAEVAAGALRRDIHVDVPELLAEQERRRTSLATALEKRAPTSWGDIRSALSTISAGMALRK